MAQQNARYQKFKIQQQLLLQTDQTSPEIPMEEFAIGTIFIPAGSPITALTYFAAYRQSSSWDPLTPAQGTNPGLTWVALQTSAGVAVTQTVAAGKAYDMPLSIQGCGAIQIRANAQGAVDISLKS